MAYFVAYSLNGVSSACGPWPEQWAITLFLGASFAALEIEVADHVVDDTFAPLKGDNDRVVFVSPL